MDNPSFETELDERGGNGDKYNEKLEETECNGRADRTPNGAGVSNGDAGETKPATVEANGKVVLVDDVNVSVIVAGEIEKEKKHFFLVRWICRYPCLMFCLALFGHLLFIAITAILYFTGYNIVNVILNDLPIFNIHDVMYNRNLAWLQREKAYPVFLFNAQYPSKRKRRSIDPYPWVDPEDIHSVRHHLLYEVQENESVFTSERLDAIRKFETSIVETFKKGAKWASPAHYVCGNESVLSILVVNETLSHLRKNVSNDIWRVGPYIGKEGVIDNVTGEVTSRLARSFVILCWTYSYHNISTWSVDEVIPEMLNGEKTFLKPVGITLFNWNYRAFSELVFRQANHDILYFIGSVLFILTFMWIQTSSLFVTCFGTASILTSFAGANLIYNCIVGYEYLGLFNILAIFVVLGIGADDIFVFYDTWKSFQDEETMEERMALTFRRAGAAMFTTSLTTMAAFFVSSFSQILPISSFGTFSGLTVFVNYMSVITFFPTVVAVHYRYFENCSCEKKCEAYDLNKASKPGGNRVFKSVSTFFGSKYCNVVTHRIGKWIIMTLFIVLVAGMMYSCTNVKLDQRVYIKAFKDDNMMETGLEKTAFNYKLGAEDKMVMVYLVWGMGARNMSLCDQLKYTHWRPCSGEAVHDEDFNIERPENQLALLNVCRNLTHLKGKLKDDLKLQSAGNGTNQVVCFMEYFDQFLRTISNLLGRKVDLKVPLRREEIEPHIPVLGALVGLKLNATAVQNPVQTTMAIFIEKNATQLKELVGFNETTNVIGNDSNGTLVYDRKMTYAAVIAPLTEQEIRLQVNEGFRLQEKWEEYTVDIMKNMPAGVNKGWQVAGSWFLARQKKDLMYRALTGIAVSLSLAFLVLLLTTRNFILAFLAEITLVGAVVCVIGVMPVAGWNFGVLESINVCFVAGLAVDYIVHVVEAYSMSAYKTKKERTRDALRRIGVSVLSGAVTTLGSSFFMFFSRILFFMQFGTFIFCTVGFSLLFALLFFPAVLDTLGPAGDIGSFRWLCNKIKRCCGR